MTHNGQSAVRSRAAAGRSAALLLIFALSVVRVIAGPPFLTDDPEPVDLNHWEFYVFGQGDQTPGYNAITGPAIEMNFGILPNTQLHLIAPIAGFSSAGSGWASGYGDTEIGVKYRFLDETDSLPQIGIFPFAELATGDSDNGLGNGRTWYRLPLWIQKNWGPWTSYGGGGLALNSAPGQRNSRFAGWLVQRDLGKYLSLGTEVFWQSSDAVGGPPTAIANFGGSIKFTDKFNLLFSAGHSISGECHTVWYLGFYWTGGPEKSETK